MTAGKAAAAAAEARIPWPSPDPSGAAFFDVDNTMMRGASIYHFARGLAKRKLFTTRDLAMFAWVSRDVPPEWTRPLPLRHRAAPPTI